MAAPYLVVLYQWLCDKKGSQCPVFEGDAFAAGEIEATLAELNSNKKIHDRIARLKFLKQEVKVQDLEKAWFASTEGYDGLSQFIEHLKQLNQKDSPFLQVVLNTLLEHPETTSLPFKTLFSAVLASNPAQFIAWYEHEQEKSYPSRLNGKPFKIKCKDTQEKLLELGEPLAFDLRELVTEHYLQEARQLFQAIPNPEGLIPLFAEHYDNLPRLASFILYLLEKGVNEDTLLHSGLLHEFFLVHAGFMYEESNPINQLYRLLNQFPNAQPLTEKAQHTSVMTHDDLEEAIQMEQQGKVSNKRYFESFSLSGSDKQSPLHIIPTTPIAFNNVLQPQNFHSLHRLFGQRLLIYLLNYYESTLDEERTSNNPAFDALLQQQFNTFSEWGLSQQDLGQLFNVLVRENEDLLETLAGLLHENTIDTLIESSCFAVFHLIPYKPNLLDKLSLAQVEQYVAHQNPDDNSFDQLILLSTILDVLQEREDAKAVSGLLFDKIIDVLMVNPVLDDSDLIQFLQSIVVGYKEQLQHQAKRLAEQLRIAIQGTITQGITESTFHELEDAWQILFRQFNVLKNISEETVKDYLPQNKYAFYISIIVAAQNHFGDQFDLQSALSCIVPYTLEGLPEDAVSEQERALIEILLATNNALLRTAAIHLLESPPINRPNWVEREYGGSVILDAAEKRGNNQLIQYLIKNKLDSEKIPHLIKASIAAAQWDRLKQIIRFTDRNTLNVELVSEVLIAAAKANKLEWLLVSDADSSPGFFQLKQRVLEFPIEPSSLLTLLTVHAEEDTLKQLFKLSPVLLKLITTRCEVTDYSDRVFPQISAFEYALWAMDWRMWAMMLECLQTMAIEGNYEEAELLRQELRQQYQKVQSKGVNYTCYGKIIQGERHFDCQPLISALATYANSLSKEDDDNRKESWCRVVGGEQRNVPAHLAQEICGKRFSDISAFKELAFTRTLKFINWHDDGEEDWFPLSSENTYRLGVDFGMYNTYQGAFGWEIADRYAAKNLVALSALYEARTQNIKDLEEQLSIPLQQRNLGAYST